jgi:hypothetical protein
MENTADREKLIQLLATKSSTKYKAFDHTFEAMRKIKAILKTFEKELMMQVGQENSNISIQYTERGDYEAELKVAADLIVFSMHTNIFEFPKAHSLMQTGYIKENSLRSYSGVINIYNFLADSFKFNRMNDVGYLIGRIFINSENHIIVEGKRQLGFLYNDFSSQLADQELLKKVVESALLYSVEFDLLVPPFEDVKMVSVLEMNQINSTISLKTGKRLGFNYKAGDIELK